jgi:hypothetical protein
LFFLFVFVFVPWRAGSVHQAGGKGTIVRHPRGPLRATVPCGMAVIPCATDGIVGGRHQPHTAARTTGMMTHTGGGMLASMFRQQQAI